MSKQELTDSQAEQVGAKLVELFCLKGKSGHIKTDRGPKSLTGVGHLIQEIVNEAKS